MTCNGLTEKQQARYKRDGFLFPIDIMSPGEALLLRQELETLELKTPDNSLPMPFSQYMSVNSHYVVTLASRLATDPRILDTWAERLASQNDGHRVSARQIRRWMKKWRYDVTIEDILNQ